MHYPDLSPYQYPIPTGLPGVLNVGWLDSGKPIVRGAVSKELTTRLNALGETPIRRMRGYHECPFCTSAPVRATGELWLRRGEIVFAAPSLIAHYVESHHYAPPADFLKALSAPDAISEREAMSLINRQLLRLQEEPTEGDLIVPYFEVRIIWRRSAFADLRSFDDFAQQLTFLSNSVSMTPRGFALHVEGHDPREAFENFANHPQALPKPHAFSYRLAHLNGEWIPGLVQP